MIRLMRNIKIYGITNVKAPHPGVLPNLINPFTLP